MFRYFSTICLTPNSQSVFRAGVLLNIHSFCYLAFLKKRTFIKSKFVMDLEYIFWDWTLLVIGFEKKNNSFATSLTIKLIKKIQILFN